MIILISYYHLTCYHYSYYHEYYHYHYTITISSSGRCIYYLLIENVPPRQHLRSLEASSKYSNRMTLTKASFFFFFFFYKVMLVDFQNG